MPEYDDKEIENKQNVKESDKGIYYKPDIDYKPDEISAYKYTGTEKISQGTIKENIANKSNIRNTHAKIDFLLNKCEEKLSKYEGFQDFKDAVIKKMYCRFPLTQEEKRKVNDFKRKLSTLETIDDDQHSDMNLKEKISNYKPKQAQEAMEKARQEIKAEFGDHDINI